jgi:UDP-glucose 4-epimerase
LRLAGRLTGRQAAVDRLIQALTVDDSAFHARFGWTPPYRLDAGLAETVDWFAAERSAATSS